MMGILQWVKKSLQPLRSAQLTQPSLPPYPVGQLPVYPALNPQTYIDQYNSNASVYTIISLMAGKFATLPRKLCEIDDTGAQDQYKRITKTNAGLRKADMMKIRKKAYKADMTPVVQNPLMDLLNHPNEYQGQDSFYASIYTYKKLTGNSYVWLNRGDNGEMKGPARYKMPILEMYVLPSQFMTVVVDRAYLFGEITLYAMWDKGQPIYFNKEDVLHWRDPNPRYDSYNFTHFYGLSPIEAGMSLITQDRAGRDAMVAMFQNGGARGVLFNKDSATWTESPEQAAARKSAIDTKINNRSQKSSVVSMVGDWGYLQMGDSAVDMEFVDTMDKVFQRICNLLGCNPQLFETKTTFNNVEQARKDLMTNAIMPDACSYRDEENRVLLQAFGLDKTKYCIDVDVANITELQDDMEKETKRVLSNWTLTPNEMREELGFETSPEPGMDEIYIPNNLILIEDAAVPTNSLSDDGTGGNDDSNDSGNQISNPKAMGLLENQVADAWTKFSTNGRH